MIKKSRTHNARLVSFLQVSELDSLFSVVSRLHVGLKGRPLKEDPLLVQHVEEIKQKYLPGYQSRIATVSLASKAAATATEEQGKERDKESRDKVISVFTK